MAWPFCFIFVDVSCHLEPLCEKKQNMQLWMLFMWRKKGKMPSKIILQLPFGLLHFTDNTSAVCCPPRSPEILTHTHTCSLVPVGTSFCQICPHCSYSVPRLGDLLPISPALCWEGCGRGTTSNLTAGEMFSQWKSGTNWAALKVEANSITTMWN